MISVSDAVNKAREYISEFNYMMPTADPRLEETELDADKRIWTITLSFGDWPSRSYKRFFIDADSGQVLSMKSPSVI